MSSKKWERTHCDACGKTPVEFMSTKQFRDEEGSLTEELLECPLCGWFQIDQQLELPDEAIYNTHQRSCLNDERYALATRSSYIGPYNDELFWKLYRCMNNSKGYKIWRELHPELDNPFNMRDFKEHPDFVRRVMEMEDYDGYDDDGDDEEE